MLVEQGRAVLRMGFVSALIGGGIESEQWQQEAAGVSRAAQDHGRNRRNFSRKVRRRVKNGGPKKSR